MNETHLNEDPTTAGLPVLRPTAPPRLATVRRPGRPKFETERFTLAQSLELTAELLTMQLRLEASTHSLNPRRRAACARRYGREFSQLVRDLRLRMDELCAAQAALEEERGGAAEDEAVRLRDQAEQRFREVFRRLAGQLPPPE